jgi:hypothetical protein
MEQKVSFKSGWRIYEEPKDDDCYIIGVDASGGIDGGNLSAIQVLSLKNHGQVACFSGTIQPDKLAEQVYLAGNKYRGKDGAEALAAVEKEKYGVLTINRLIGKYTNLYYHTQSSIGWKPRIETDYGWNPRYRDEAIKRLKIDMGYKSSYEKADKSLSIQIYDRETLREMSHFIRDKKSGKEGAQRGKTDDLVSALYIANFVWNEKKETMVEPVAEIKESEWDAEARRLREMSSEDYFEEYGGGYL